MLSYIICIYDRLMPPILNFGETQFYRKRFFDKNVKLDDQQNDNKLVTNVPQTSLSCL